MAGDAKAAVNAQALLRAFHELESLAPRLSSLSEQLQYTQLIKDNTEDHNRTEKALTAVEALAFQLKRLVAGARDVQLPDVPPSVSVAQPSTPPRKRAKRTVDSADSCCSHRKARVGTLIEVFSQQTQRLSRSASNRTGSSSHTGRGMYREHFCLLTLNITTASAKCPENHNEL